MALEVIQWKLCREVGGHIFVFHPTVPSPPQVPRLWKTPIIIPIEKMQACGACLISHENTLRWWRKHSCSPWRQTWTRMAGGGMDEAIGTSLILVLAHLDGQSLYCSRRFFIFLLLLIVFSSRRLRMIHNHPGRISCLVKNVWVYREDKVSRQRQSVLKWKAGPHRTSLTCLRPAAWEATSLCVLFEFLASAFIDGFLICRQQMIVKNWLLKYWCSQTVEPEGGSVENPPPPLPIRTFYLNSDQITILRRSASTVAKKVERDQTHSFIWPYSTIECLLPDHLLNLFAKYPEYLASTS